MSLTNKTFASYYKNIVGVFKTANTGITSSPQGLRDGAGNKSCIALSDDVLYIQPQNDNTLETLRVVNQSGSAVLKVDTTNSKVLAGASQVAVNTQYAYFGVSSLTGLSAVAGTHYLIPFGNTWATTAAIAFGTGTNPSTSYDVSANNNGDDLTVCLWYVPDNITIDQVYLLAGGNAASGDTINIHLLSFDFDAGAGAGKGDLSNGIVVAGGADIASLGYENVIYQSTAPSSADVDAGKVIVATFESNGTNSDYACQIVTKYHIR